MVKKLIPVGDSTGLILDPEILQQADIAPDSQVEVNVEGNAIVIRPHRYAVVMTRGPQVRRSSRIVDDYWIAFRSDRRTS